MPKEFKLIFDNAAPLMAVARATALNNRLSPVKATPG
jgi:hypothetical protein